MNASQSKGEKDMRYMKTSLTAAAAVILISGFGASEVEASASMGGQSQAQPEYENVWNQDDFQSDLHRFFHHWDSDWQNNNWSQQDVEKPENEDPNHEEMENETPEAPVQDSQNPEANADEQQSNGEEQADKSELSEYEQEVVKLTNEEREKNGLEPLEIDKELSSVAREKSSDMQENNYFDHNSPTYGSPFDMMDQFQIDYTSAGENIAKGQPTPEEVVNAWMNSEGHRENILNGSFTHIGVGYLDDGNVWTQQFIQK